MKGAKEESYTVFPTTLANGAVYLLLFRQFRQLTHSNGSVRGTAVYIAPPWSGRKYREKEKHTLWRYHRLITKQPQTERPGQWWTATRCILTNPPTRLCLSFLTNSYKWVPYNTETTLYKLTAMFFFHVFSSWKEPKKWRNLVTSVSVVQIYWAPNALYIRTSCSFLLF